MLCCFLFCSMDLLGQTKVVGEVVDDGERTTKLVHATVMLLQAKDSILVAHTRVDLEGRFSLMRPDTADYLLVVSYPKFGAVVKNVIGNKDLNLGQVALTSVRHLLEEIVVTGKIPIVIKGDTTEYNASSFTVEKNAKVEDLLRVLPGITVDANGQITAQGKKVEKVLVDGEEFFGNDPTLVTKNIRSDMVDKVQVYEKKTEEAERTGVDDGQRLQTINLKLKEDAKKGVFGKIDAGGGGDKSAGYYTGKVAVNKFSGSQKIGFYALGSNDGTVSLNWEDSDKFGFSNMSTEVGDDGGMYFSWSGDEMDYWDGRGKPKAWSTGVSFADSWKGGKHKVNMSYKLGHTEKDEVAAVLSQENAKDSILNSNDNSTNFSSNDKHRFNGRYDLNIDSLTTATFSMGASKGKSESDRTRKARNSDGDDVTLNDNTSSQHTITDKQGFNYSVYLTRKFRKEGRSFSLRANGEVNEDKGNGFLQSTTNLYNAGELHSKQEIDQRKEMISKRTGFRSSLTYSEPITKKLTSSLQYEFSRSNASSVNNSYNKIDGEYDDLDLEFSNDFDFNTTRHGANLSFNYRSDLLDAGVTNSFRNDNLYQVNNYQKLDLNRDYFTYSPSVFLRYKLSKSKSVGLRFNRYNNLPSLSQVQPLKQNTDPLNIIVGNENLKPSQSNEYGLSYNAYNPLKDRYSYANVGWSQQFNNIQQNITIAEGIRTFFYTNLEDVGQTFRFYGGTGMNVWKKKKVRINLELSGGYNNYFNYINGDLSENNNMNYAFSLGFNRYAKKGLDFDVGFRPRYNVLKNSLQPNLNSNGFEYGLTGNLAYFLPLKIKVYSDMDYTYQAPTGVFNEKFDRLLWKPGVSKKFLKNESLTMDFYVQDALNQNVGFSRRQNGSTLVQERYNTIGRFFMLQVSWDFTSMKGGAE